VEGEVLLFEEEFEEEAVEAAEEVPVDVAEVVADDVGAVVGELDGLAAVLRASLALEFAREDLARGDVHLGEAGDEVGGEEVLDRPGALDGWGAEHGACLLRLRG